MLILSNTKVSVKIAPEDSISIIGSNSINTAGDLYVLNLNTITKPSNQRFKSLIDKVLVVLLLISLPVNLWFVKNKIGLLRNLILVFLGKYSWVGFYKNECFSNYGLPLIKPGVLTPVDSLKTSEKANEKVKNNLNVSYAKNYRVSTDIFIFFRGFKKIGQRPD